MSSLKARVAALEATISTDNQTEAIAGERLDEQTVNLGRDQTQLAAIRRNLVVVRHKTAAAMATVRTQAVQAYVFGDSAAAQFGAVLSRSLNDAGSVTTYAGVATGALHTAVVALQVDEAHLRANETAESSTVARADAAVSAAATARNQTASIAAQVRDTLSGVKGNLAQAIAQQEAAAAAAAATAARAAAAVAQRAQAEAEAQAAAAVAQSIANADPSSTAAAAAAASATSNASAASAIGQPTVAPTGSTSGGSAAVSAAEQYLGVPYVWGGASSSGLDCSGLTMLAWGAAGVALTHSAYYQYLASQPVPLTQLEPGDLLFYDFPNDGTTDPVSHVAMYVGSGPYGTQTVIQAPETGETVSYVPMYFGGLVGAGRP